MSEITPSVQRATEQINAMLGPTEPKFVPNHTRSVLNAALRVHELADLMADHGRDVTRPTEIACLCGSVFNLHGVLRQHVAECYVAEILGGAA